MLCIFIDILLMSIIIYLFIKFYIYKQPGGWETALVVVNVLKKKCYGAVAPYAFL